MKTNIGSFRHNNYEVFFKYVSSNLALGLRNLVHCTFVLIIFQLLQEWSSVAPWILMMKEINQLVVGCLCTVLQIV